MTAVRLLQTVETRVVFADDEVGVKALNDVALKGAYEVARAELEGGFISALYKIPGGSEVDLPARAAKELVALGYAELVK